MSTQYKLAKAYSAKLGESLTAQRRPGQEVDPFIYSDYYILLERIYILYTYYQRTYNAKLISIKDELISINEKIISINEELISRKKSS